MGKKHKKHKTKRYNDNEEIEEEGMNSKLYLFSIWSRDWPK